MNNHSLIDASGNTHAKIALLAFAASMVFVLVVSAAGMTKSDSMGTRAYGPVVEASPTVSVAGSGLSVVR